MPEGEFGRVMQDIRNRVAVAVAGAKIGHKPFAKKAGMGETVVRDLVKAHNKDVQLSTLDKIARGAGVPLVTLLPGQMQPISRPALERALAEALPERPQDEAKCAEYLAQVVIDALQLPDGLLGEPANDLSSGAVD